LSASGFDSGFYWATLLDIDIVLGKFIDGRLAGLIAFRHVPENLGNFVDLLEVAKPFRHRQVAKKLLAMVMLDSFQTPDFDGFMQLRPKQNGIQYFYLNLADLHMTLRSSLIPTPVIATSDVIYLLEEKYYDPSSRSSTMSLP
jgi:hypothetical protein